MINIYCQQYVHKLLLIKNNALNSARINAMKNESNTIFGQTFKFYGYNIYIVNFSFLTNM